MAQSNLNSLVENVEFYRLARGQYPETLEELKSSFPKNSAQALNIIDPRALDAKTTSRYFFYKKVDADHYYLRGVAPDGKPFSPGALAPQVTTSANLGLLIAPPQNPSPDAQ